MLPQNSEFKLLSKSGFSIQILKLEFLKIQIFSNEIMFVCILLVCKQALGQRWKYWKTAYHA